MGKTFVYPLGDSLYINLTNKCSNDCTFCIRAGSTMSGFDLWLDYEPSAAEVIAGLQEFPQFCDIVFCGYGEPTYCLPVLLATAKYIREQGKTVRLNTNGLGSFINGRDITPDLAACVDVLSVSLNAPDANSYNAVSRPQIPNSFEHMLDFVKNAVARGISVVLSAVDVITNEQAAECESLAASLGAEFRLREFIQPENEL